MNRRSLTRVEREWSAFPFQPLDDLFALARTDSADAAEALGEGLAWTWITWFMALSKPVRRRNARQLADYYALPQWMRDAMVRKLVGDEAEAFQFLRNLMVGVVRNQWVRHAGDEPDGRLPPPDWDQWSGPGSG